MARRSIVSALALLVAAGVAMLLPWGVSGSVGPLSAQGEDTPLAFGRPLLPESEVPRPGPTIASPPSCSGFIPPPMDLSHLRGDRMPAGVSVLSLQTRWDWREAGKVSPVGSQGTCGACYAFAALGNIESKLLIDGVGTWNFSENHAKECNWPEMNSSPGSPWDMLGSCKGGNFFMLANLFSTKGMVLDTCDPYVPQDVQCKTGCAYQKTLLDWRLLNGRAVPDTSVLKGYIQSYGPVETGVYAGNGDAWANQFGTYDGSYTLYYTGTERANHRVLIIGWDDNLSHQGGKGGWIVKNSWSTAWGGTCGYGTERGFFTIAYGSANIGSYSSCMLDWQDYDPNGTVLYYDDAGWTGDFGTGASTTAWGLCKFIPTADGQVTGFDFWTNDQNTGADVFVYDRFDGNQPINLLWSREGLSYAEPGYHSVAVNPPVAVNSGNDVIAVVKFRNESFKYPVTTDSWGPAERGRTYFSASGTNGSWQDVGASSNMDVAIRLRMTARAAEVTPTATATWAPFTPVAWVRLPIILRNLAWPNPPTPRATATPTRTTGPAQTATPTTEPSGWVTVFHEDFEGAFPGQWELRPSTGDYLWGKRNCRPHAGSYSAWGVGGGDGGASLPCGSNYPDDVQTAMVYGPFSLEGASAAELALQVWLNSESFVDELFVGVSTDGTSFFGVSDSGGWQDWDEWGLDLGNFVDEPEVWIGLIFESDYSVNYAEGVYVDDILMRKWTSGGWNGTSPATTHRAQAPRTRRPAIRTLAK